MNEQLIKIGLESGMLNYVDNETPRYYFLSGHANEQDLEKFAELIVRECAGVGYDASYYECALNVSNKIKEHFGVEE